MKLPPPPCAVLLVKILGHEDPPAKVARIFISDCSKLSNPKVGILTCGKLASHLLSTDTNNMFSSLFFLVYVHPSLFVSLTPFCLVYATLPFLMLATKTFTLLVGCVLNWKGIDPCWWSLPCHRLGPTPSTMYEFGAWLACRQGQ